MNLHNNEAGRRVSSRKTSCHFLTIDDTHFLSTGHSKSHGTGLQVSRCLWILVNEAQKSISIGRDNLILTDFNSDFLSFCSPPLFQWTSWMTGWIVRYNVTTVVSRPQQLDESLLAKDGGIYRGILSITSFPIIIGLVRYCTARRKTRTISASGLF